MKTLKSPISTTLPQHSPVQLDRLCGRMGFVNMKHYEKVSVALKIKVKAGTRFGMLTVLREADRFVQPNGIKVRAFLCLCDCGEEKIVRLSHLRHNRVRTCGCSQPKRVTYHKQLYSTWRAMKNRCNNPNNIGKKYYYDKGITIDPTWESSYNAFSYWALRHGWEPGMYIDRIDSSKNYCPKNCRFVTPKESSRNLPNLKRFNYKGELLILPEILERIGRSHEYNCISERIRRGISFEKAITLPVRQGNYKRKSQRD